MSLWLKRKKEDGGSDYILFPGAEMLLPATIFLVLLITIGLAGGLLLFSLGFVSFLVAKISQLAKGNYTSWGSKSMSRIFRYCYFVGYGLMTAGLLATLLSLKMNR
jgi:hypothetical protein